MADKIVTARHAQVCDLCKGRIEAGERCRLVRDDFWPPMTWFEHLRCPNTPAVAAEPVRPTPLKPLPAMAYAR